MKKLEHRYKTKFTDEKSKQRHILDKDFTQTEEYINLLSKLKYEKEQ